MPSHGADVFDKLATLAPREARLALQAAGCGKNLPDRAAMNELLTAAHHWAVTEDHRRQLLAAVNAALRTSQRPSRSLRPWAARRQTLMGLANEHKQQFDGRRFFIEPDIQEASPRDRGPAAAPEAGKTPAFRFIAAFVRERFVPDPGRSRLFILGDAGTGKTSLLVMLTLRHLTWLLPQRHRWELLKLGRDSLDRIDAVPDPSKTVLLLDSLDEDPVAREHAGGVTGRLDEIMAHVGSFHRVVVTCRTQYFPQDSASLREAGYVRLGDHESPLRYLSLFSDAQVERYLSRRFPRSWRRAFRRHPHRAEARRAAGTMGSLSLRPLLLSYIEDFVGADGRARVDYHNTYAVHRHLMEQWLRREANKLEEEGSGLPSPEGLRVSVALALHLARRDLRHIHRDDLLGIPALAAVDRFKLEARSLINRTADDRFEFAHRTFQEFLLAHAVLDAGCKADLTGIRLSREAAEFVRDGWVAQDTPRLDLRGATLDDEALVRLLHHLFGIQLIRVEPGRFQMGSPEAESGRWEDEGPVHEVRIEPGFWLGETPVTQAQYEAVTGATPSRFRGGCLPVENVSWAEARTFCQSLTARAQEKGVMRMDWVFRLPTEAEWEYACRAGTRAALYSGQELTSTRGRCRNLDEVAWYGGNAHGTTHAVKGKAPNAWGAHDMLGNVWEWCEDEWHDRYEGAPGDGRAWVEGGSERGVRRVVRGGGWGGTAECHRCAFRTGFEPDFRRDDFGFRLVLAPSSAGDPGHSPG